MIRRDEFLEICQIMCPLCGDDVWKLRLRPETREWVHDKRSGSMISHTICAANAFRNSRFAEVMKDG